MQAVEKEWRDKYAAELGNLNALYMAKGVHIEDRQSAALEDEKVTIEMVDGSVWRRTDQCKKVRIVRKLK